MIELREKRKETVREREREVKCLLQSLLLVPTGGGWGGKVEVVVVVSRFRRSLQEKSSSAIGFLGGGHCRRLGARKIADEGVEGAAELDDGLWVGAQGARSLTAIVETRQRRKCGRRDEMFSMVDERFGVFDRGRRLGEQDVFALRRLCRTLFLRWRRRACLRLPSSFPGACYFVDML